jgi:hypothetical protein
MKGEKQIIDSRKRGRKPSSIFVEINHARVDDENQLIEGALPVVTIEDQDLKHPLDLRFMVGCQVNVNAPAWTEDVLAVADKIVAAGAAHVIVCCILEDNTIMEWLSGKWEVHA